MRSLKEIIENLNLVIQEFDDVLADGIGNDAGDLREIVKMAIANSENGNTEVNISIRHFGGQETIEWSIWDGKDMHKASSASGVIKKLTVQSPKKDTLNNVQAVINSL